MIEIKNTIQEIIEEEANAEKVVGLAIAKANELKQAVEIEIENQTKSLVDEGKRKASKLLEEAKLSATAKANALIEAGRKQSNELKSESEKNIPDVSDYIIHKLKVNYGDR